MVLAFAALGFGLFTGPVLQNLYLEDHFGLESFGRGVVGTATAWACCSSCRSRPGATTPCSGGTRRGRCACSAS